MDKLAVPPEFDAHKAMLLPLGVASPLWLAFGGAAAAGMAFYWMSRWRAATNLEAFLAPSVQAAESVAETALEEVEAAAETFIEEIVEPLVEALPEPVVETAPDDLTRMVGIGPKVAAALAERGVTRFEQIAAWTAEDIAETDKTLKLMGRIEREKWLAQAKRLAASA